MRKKFQTYNDGVAELYEERKPLNSFGASTNACSVDGMDPAGSAAFALQAKRREDVELADAMGFKLTVKIRCRLKPGVDIGCMAVIDDYLYRVSYMDASRTEMWLYLEGVNPIGSPSDS